jgi:uncharacterized protein (UPF0335 family)
MTTENQTETPGKGHNISGDRIRAFIEHIERLEAEKKALSEDIKDVYGEAKAVGFSPKIIRKIIALRKTNLEKRREEQELLELYDTAAQLNLFS